MALGQEGKSSPQQIHRKTLGSHKEQMWLTPENHGEGADMTGREKRETIVILIEERGLLLGLNHSSAQ